LQKKSAKAIVSIRVLCQDTNEKDR